MKILCVFGRHNYGDPARGEGYEYRHFLPALRALGHEVELFDSFSRLVHRDFAHLNTDLLETVNRFRPQLMFCVLMGYEVWLETLEAIRASGVRLLNWGTDDSWKYREFSRFVAPAFDLWATTSRAAWQAARADGHANFVLTQWAADAHALAEPLQALQCRHAVSFVGSAYGNRPRWVQALRDRGIEVACFGHGWPAGPVAAEAIPHILRESVVSLNFGDSGLRLQGLALRHNRQLKARVFEVTGAGGCLMTEPADELADCFEPGREVEVFRQPDELAAKLRHLLDHPDARDAMARAGQARARREHTYETRFSQLLAALPAVQATRPVDLSDHARVASRHRRDGPARWLRQALAGPCELVWGRPRGTRAARRLLFEWSWRISGRRTYEARGLPGRLFYRES